MIYLDHNATTPVLPHVLEAMLPYLKEQWGNPSSSYRFGTTMKGAVDDAREKIAALLEADSSQIVFTSGGTESNNTAIHSAVLAAPGKRHVVTSQIEHSSVLNYCRFLERHHAYRVTYLPPNREGQIALADLEEAISEETAVVSLMWANNETGGVSPAHEIAALCRRHGVAFHCDAVQAVGKMKVDSGALGADFLSMSGHKIGAPKGIAVLVVRDTAKFVPLIHGGKQEGDRRGGTESVPSIIGLGAAAGIATKTTAWSRVRKLRNQMEQELLEAIPGSRIHGANVERLPNTTNIYLPGIDADAAVTFLDQRGICVSSGSACMESAIAPSHVILAMTGSHEEASESLRISLGRQSTGADVSALVEHLKQFAALQV